jgi:hypothetical protein
LWLGNLPGLGLVLGSKSGSQKQAAGYQEYYAVEQIEASALLFGQRRPHHA